MEKARQLLEEAAAESLPTEQVDALPSGFYDAFVLCGIRVHTVNSGNFLHGGATASLVDLVGTAVFYTSGAQTRGSPLEMNISYLDAAFSDEEIDIEAKVLRAGKAVGVATVELKKKSGKIIAQARYSKYLGASSKL
ncbi:unnamed protein product [Triticum turgidum subsp. durum]|uniref:Thioesterase domain-containing protein n=1 Tax=Triticum turgidum subsp. durum TaxID=4567 RepID=A0A9R0TFJ8_TRITD|nr:unnamed protein product [Triticum turgidum subsp. durum]